MALSPSLSLYECGMYVYVMGECVVCVCVSVQNSTQIVRDQLSGIGLDHSTLFWGQGVPSVL